MNTQRTVGVCATCPWRKPNQGKPHPANWYTLANLQRLWNGLRRGIAPGMVCHSTDPESIDYGSTKTVPETARTTECGGAIAVVIQHVNDCGKSEWGEYRARHRFPLTKAGLRFWVSRSMFPPFVPSVTGDRLEEIGLPWDKEKK